MVGANPNNDDYGVIRVKLLAEPKALPGMRLLTTYTHVDSTMPQIEGVRVPVRGAQGSAAASMASSRRMSIR